MSHIQETMAQMTFRKEDWSYSNNVVRWWDNAGRLRLQHRMVNMQLHYKTGFYTLYKTGFYTL
jgi:hypothetical protein